MLTFQQRGKVPVDVFVGVLPALQVDVSEPGSRLTVLAVKCLLTEYQTSPC